MSDTAGLTGRQIIARFLRRSFVAVVLIAAVVYVGDFLVLRYRVARNQTPFGTVTVRPYYAVPRKDHRVEFMFQDPEDETCVNSLLPHMGDSPCWYLRRNPQKRIDM